MIMMQLRRHSIVQHAAHASRSSTSSSSNTQQQQQQQQHGTAATHAACAFLGSTHTNYVARCTYTHWQALPHTPTHTRTHTHTSYPFAFYTRLQLATVCAACNSWRQTKKKKKIGVCRGKGQQLAHCLAWAKPPCHCHSPCRLARLMLPTFLSFALHFDCNWSRLSARCISMSWRRWSQAWPATNRLLPPHPTCCCLPLCGKKSLKVIHCNAWRCRGCCISLRQLWAVADPLFDGSTHHLPFSPPPLPCLVFHCASLRIFAFFPIAFSFWGFPLVHLLYFFCGASRRTLCKCIRRDY